MKKLLLVVVVLFALFMGFGIYIGSTPEGKERAKQRDEIEFCWQQQSKKSLDPGIARLMAATCEKMEYEYKNKWGHSP